MLQVSQKLQSTDIKHFHSYNGKRYFDHPNAITDHEYTTIADIEGKVLAVGGASPDNKKVEIFDIDTNTWTEKSEFPFCSDR